MSAGVTARGMARANLTGAIKDAARHRVAVHGAVKLSVRAVARDVGMVSSAVYRYFPTRDHLLTALIVDAYDALGVAVEQADAAVPVDEVRARWRAMGRAVRQWARQHPHEYGLIFGSPIPDYRAPVDTIAPAGRLPVALFAALQHGWSTGRVEPATGSAIPAVLLGQLESLADALASEMPAILIQRGATAWTQMMGMVTFELFGQFVGSFDPADEFFEFALDSMADFLGMAPVDVASGPDGPARPDGPDGAMQS